jgi:hypothetical protein
VKKKKITKVLLLICLLVCFISCKKEDVTQPSSDPFEKWASYNIHNYSVDQTRSCFCINGGEKIRLVIKSDTIYSATKLSDGTILLPGSYSVYRSVTSLFGYIKSSKDSMVIRYNEKYGYPEYLDINPQLHPVDGGALYETVNLQIQ